MSNIGEQIRSARKAKGMTQEALAEVLHISRQGISHWESGRTMPDAATLLKLSDILEYTFEAGQTVEELPNQRPEVQPQPPETPAELPQEPKEPMKPLYIVLLTVAATLLVVGCIAGLFALRKTPAVVSMEILNTPLYLQRDSDHPLGYSWKVTVLMHNESDVPFKPDKIVNLLYAGPRITSKAYVTYEEMRPWMDTDYMLREDVPFDWNFTCSADDVKAHTHVEVILYGTDEHGNELKFSVTEPLIAEYAQE